MFQGEAALRQELRARGLNLPEEILPLGWIERPSPAGPALLLVFGRRIERVAAAVLLARAPEDGRDPSARTMGDGALYDRVGIFARAREGSYPAQGLWLETGPGGAWTKQGRPADRDLRLCLPCSGWLCSGEPLACFSDFNDDGWEEAHITGECPEGRACRLTLAEGSRAGARVLFQGELGAPSWRRYEGGWVLVPRPLCGEEELCAQASESLGRLGCSRPQVFRLDRGQHRLVPDAALRNRFHPVSYRRLPRGCPALSGSVEAWTPEQGFIRYRP